MGRRGWAILLGVIGIALVAGLAVWALASSSGGAEASPSATATPAPSATATPSPTPSPSLTAQEDAVPATCATISTAEFQAMMASNGWVSWETQDQQVGARPFDRFPDGAPAGSIVCRWGAAPDAPTDNVMDLAWGPLTSGPAAAAQEALLGQGFERSDAPEGVYLAMKPGAGDWVDGEGYGETYLFTDDDVRWARTKEDVAYVKAPDEQG